MLGKRLLFLDRLRSPKTTPFRACSKSPTKRLRQINQSYHLKRVCFYRDERLTEQQLM